MMHLKLYQKTRLLQGLHLCGTLWGLFIIADWYWIGAGLLAYFFYETFGGNIGLHRYFGHRSFQTTPYWDFFLCVMANLVGAGSTLSWVGVHRIHHANSDLPTDVHSPYHQSMLKIFFGKWDVIVPASIISDLSSSKMHRFFHRNYFLLHFFTGATLFLISLKAFLFLYCMPCTMCLGSGYVLAFFGHVQGYQTYSTADQSRNSWVASLYTFGEGWHNNHHHNPGKFRQGERWWEFDIPAFFISHMLVTHEYLSET